MSGKKKNEISRQYLIEIPKALLIKKQDIRFDVPVFYRKRISAYSDKQTVKPISVTRASNKKSYISDFDFTIQAFL